MSFLPQLWTGLDGLGKQELEELRKECEIKLVAVGAFYSGEIKKTLSGPRHGRTYYVPSQRRKGGRRTNPRTYTASAPGEPPAVLTGNLRNSVGFSRPTWNGNTVSIEVGPGLAVIMFGPKMGQAEVSYARILEWGGVTRTGARILPRPYMEPTAIRVEPQIDRMLAA